MANIKITKTMKDVLVKKGIADKSLLLIVDDGGGKYSSGGGACSIGERFAIVVLEKDDPEFPIELNNDAGIDLHSSKYSLTFVQDNPILDYQHHNIVLKDDSGIEDSTVMVTNGAQVLAEAKKGMTHTRETC